MEFERIVGRFTIRRGVAVFNHRGQGGAQHAGQGQDRQNQGHGHTAQEGQESG